MPLSDEQILKLDALNRKSKSGDINLSLNEALNQTPDDAVKFQSMAQQTGLPTDVVARNYPEVSKQAHMAALDAEKLLSESPVTANYLSDPNNASVSIDDIDTLTGLEDVMSEKNGLLENTARNVASTVTNIFGDLLEFGGTVSEGITSEMTDLGIPSPGVVVGEDGISWSWDTTKEDIPSSLSVIGGYFSEGERARFGYKPDFTFEKLEGDITPTNVAGYMFEQGVGSLPHMLASMKVLPTYLLSVTQRIAEGRAQNDLRTDADVGDLVDSFIPAVAVSLIDRIAGNYLFRPKPFTTVAGAGAAVGVGAASETGTEFVQEIVEYAGESVGTRVGFEPGEAVRRGVAGGIAGFGMGAGITAARAPFDLRINRAQKTAQRMFTSAMEQQSIDQVISLSQSSTTSERAQDKFQGFLRALGKDRAVYIPASEIQSLVEQGIDVPVWITSQATNPDVDVSIPMDRFAGEIAKDQALVDALRPHIKWSSDSMTSTEMAEGSADAMAALIRQANLDKEMRAESDRIYDDIVEQLVATGRQSALTAKWSAAIIPAYVTTTAQRTGLSVAEVYQKMGFRIEKMDQGPTVGDILSQAKSEGYQGADVYEAAEWSAAVANGLDMSRDARMARAAEQGYDRRGFHGSREDLSEMEGFDTSMATFGRRGTGAWIAENPIQAETYARTATIPVVLNSEGFGYVDFGGMTWMAAPEGAELAVPNGESIDVSGMTTNDISRLAGEMGLPGVMFDQIIDLGGKVPRDLEALEDYDYAGDRQYSVHDASRIRSPNAAFDPDQAASTNLLAQDALRRETINIPGRGEVEFGPFEKAREVARSLGAKMVERYVPVQRKRAERIANEYTLMKHDPSDPEVAAAYAAMIKETREQFDAIIEQTGLEIHFIRGENPYADTPRQAILDIVENNQFYVFSTRDGFGSDETIDVSDNPLLAETDVMIDGEPALANDLFRIVHDYFGYAMNGVGFRAGGEENAWQAHAGMYSKLARRAMTTETRGQNSWVNYGPHGEFNRTASGDDTIYADQKVGLLPVWVSEENYANDDRPYPDSRVSESGELLSPPVENGRIELVHFSRTPGIERINPDYFGANYAGAERQRAGRPNWLNRTYYGIKPGVSGGYQKESRTGGQRYVTSVDARLLYDMAGNPDNLPKTDINSYEKAIRDAGYVGYWVKHPSMGLVAASFDPLYVEKQPGLLNQAQKNDIGLYSGLENAVLNLRLPEWKKEDGRATGKSIIQKLQPGKTDGVKAEELEWTGVVQFLEAGDKFTREEVAAFIRANGVQVEEIYADQAESDQETDVDWYEEIIDDEGYYESEADYYMENPRDWFGYQNWVEDNTEDFLDEISDPAARARAEELVNEGNYFGLRSALAEYGLDYYGIVEVAAESDIEEQATYAAREAHMQNPVVDRTFMTDDGTIARVQGSDDFGWQMIVDGREIGDRVYDQTEAENAVILELIERGHMRQATTADQAKWRQYVARGRVIDYAELKLTLPDVAEEAFEYDVHFDDPNIVAFIRRTNRPGFRDDEELVVTDEMVAGDEPPPEFWLVQHNKTWSDHVRDADNPDELRGIENARGTWAGMSIASRKEIYRTGPRAPSPGLYFVEELQSDWHQQGRTAGYKTGEEDTAALDQEANQLYGEITGAARGLATDLVAANTIEESFKENAVRMIESLVTGETKPDTPIYRDMKAEMTKSDIDFSSLERAYTKIQSQMNAARNGVPNAPFKGDAWLELGLKRALIDAVDNDADQFAWSDSNILADRWDEAYRSAYTLQYDEKMVSMVKKITKEQPRHVHDDGDPHVDHPKMLRNEKQIAAQLEKGPVYMRTVRVTSTGPSGVLNTDMIDNWDIYQLEKDKAAGISNSRIEVYSNNPRTVDQGLWVIDLTPELKARIKAEGLSLFQQPEAPRGQIELLNNERIIKLGTASDLSTFLHEAGHLFLEVEKQLASEGFVNDDMQAILDFVGAKSMDEITAETPEGVEMHEKFARAFEAYLREGKAPSLGLRNAFARIKEWMMRIYQSVSQLDVELNDEVRGVFDRMLATQTEIQEAMGNPAYDQYFESKEQAGMTAEQWEEYQKKVQARKDRTTETVDEKVMKEYRNRLSREWEEEKAPLVEEELERLSKEPVYAMLSDLASAPLDYTMVMEALGGGTLPGKLIGKARKVDGVDPAEYAEVYGWNTVGQMLADIQAAPSLKAAADAAAQARMIEMHGDILNDGTIEAEVKEALHNEAQADLLLAELKALKPAGRPSINRDYLKAEAKRLIGTMKYGEIKPNKYLRAEIKAAQRAAGARPGMKAEIFDAKVQQLVNHYLYREAVETRQQMERNRRYVKRAQTRSYDNKAVDPSYIANIKAVSTMYDLSTKQDRQDRVDSILNWYQTQLADENKFVDMQLLDPNLLLALKAKEDGQLAQFDMPTFDDLTADDLRGLTDMIKHMRFVGGQMADTQNNEITAQRNALFDSVEENGGRDVKDPETIGRPTPGMDSFKHLINSLPSLRNLLRKLDGFKTGVAFDLIYKSIEDMTNARLDLGVRIYEKFEQELDGVHNIGLIGTGLTTNMRRKYGMNVPGEFTITSDAGRQVTMNYEELFMVALYWGTESSREAIREGHGLTDGDVMRLMSNLNPDQLNYVNAVWRVNESLWPDLSSASVKRYGVAPEKLEATPFEVNGVQLSGGHMRLFYNSLELELKNEQQAGESYATIVPTKAGSLHERIGSGGRPVNLDKNNIARALEENIHFIAFAEGSQTIRRIVNGREVQAMIQQKHGNGFHRALIDQLDNLMRNKSAVESYPGLAKMFKLTRRAATARHLMFSVRNTVQQFSSLPIITQEVGPINLYNSMAKFATDGGASRDMVLEKSAYMRNRSSFVNREASEYLKKMSMDSKMGHIWEKFQSVGFAPQTFVDSMFAFPTWLARYEQGINDHGDERRAVSDADTSVAESVGSGADIHLGGAFNSNTTEFARTMTLFGSWFNSYYNRMYRDSNGFSTFTPATFATVVTTPMIAAILSSVLVTDYPDEDDENWLWWATKRYVGFMAGTIPIVRDIVGFGLSGFSPKTVLAGAQEGPVRVIQEVESYIEGRQTGVKLASDVTKVVTSVVPVPGAGELTRVVDYLDSYYAGKEGEFNAYQMLVEGPERNK